MRRREDHTAVVDDTGRADADPEHGRVGVRDESTSELDDGRDDVLVGGKRDFATGDDAAVERQHRADEGVAARQVEPDDAMAGVVEVDEDRGLAGAGGLAHAHFGDEAVGDEFGDQIGDGDAGEPGLAGEVGPAHRPLVEQRLQHERAVVTAGVLGEYFGALAQRASRTESSGIRGVRRVDEGRAALRFRG